jgi:pimeloyl-ACP methyl ester carboxylesterase
MNPVKRLLIGPARTTSYLEAGPEAGPLMVFVHGWPGLASTWRHQLDHFAARGYRVVAPDMRGYGDSTVHQDPAAYRQELVVGDMLALLDHLDRRRAVWIGHDWGCPTVADIAAHFPERCVAAVALAVPFGTLERGWDGLLTRVDRTRYPEDTHPHGQFDYMAFYESNAKQATSVFGAAPGNTVKVLFRRGDPAVHTRPSPTSVITRDGGWFGGAPSAPGCTAEHHRPDRARPCGADRGPGPQRVPRAHRLLPQPRGQRPLCGRGARRPPAPATGPVRRRRLRRDLRPAQPHGAGCDAFHLHRPHRGHRSHRALAPARGTGPGERPHRVLADRTRRRTAAVVTELTHRRGGTG